MAGEAHAFGRKSLIPEPFDPRLILRIAPAVAQAAMESGVATRPIEDLVAYADRLSRFVFRSGFIMKPLFPKAKDRAQARHLCRRRGRAGAARAQVVIEEGIAKPILIGRPSVVEARLKRFGLSIGPGDDFELVDPEDDPRYRDYVATYVEARRAQGHHAGRGRDAGAHQHHRDRARWRCGVAMRTH